MNQEIRHLVTEKYLRGRHVRRLMALTSLTIFVASVILAHAGAFGRCGDDWARFDHQSFRVAGTESGGTIRVSLTNGSMETVRLLGVASPAAGALQWLRDRTAGQPVTLLLQWPQTRDKSGSLLAFVFVDHSNLNVDLAAEGLIFADRRKKSAMDGLIAAAETAARKKKVGMWADLKSDQMPQWRKDWLRSLPERVGNTN